MKKMPFYRDISATTSRGRSWSTRTLVNKFYTIMHSFSRLWNTILEVLGIFQCELTVPDSQRAEGRRQSKTFSNLIKCCMTFTSAHSLKALAHDSPVENGWRILGITLQFIGQRAGATVRLTGAGWATTALRDQKWTVSPQQCACYHKREKAPLLHLSDWQVIFPASLPNVSEQWTWCLSF